MFRGPRRRDSLNPSDALQRDAGYNPPLQVVGYVATRAGDEERGPLVRLNADEARLRMLTDGELAWVYGPRRHDLAAVVVDDTVPRGGVVLRDVAGATLTDVVKLVKINTDAPRPRGLA